MSVESVASAGASQPAKKRRLNSGTDRSVVDTASSARPDYSVDQKHLSHDDDAQSCCIGEVQSDHQFALREGAAEGDDGPDDRKRRRERIQETVAALRKIVPRVSACLRLVKESNVDVAASLKKTTIILRQTKV
ncbi:hypothetical protein E2562_011737 [Oryza meyeriana var. granulata]|uniref:BHLH domain-containing protein n=1 Tax=Oryza meyeriana var. granulata TaxID=110450 RepID=A0A6G1DH63_9ORYZ|nr:hypothetical protein E2562_011737 [Oryza meyeriana var. granulata]